MRQFEHRGNIVDAVRYEPGWDGHVINQLANAGVGCLHFRKPTETIEIFSYGMEISITDPRHDFDGAEGIVYAGDWVVWQSSFDIEIVPSSVFSAEYTPVEGTSR